jgi:osmotically-inducible protein OsmY
MADHAPEPTVVAEPEISDLDLQNSIEEGLWSLDSIRVSKPALEIYVRDGRGTVSGIVASPMMRQQIEEVLSGLPVTLDVMDDGGIHYAASYALATDARTASIPPGYRLTAHNGRIYVKGKLTPEQAQAVRDVVSEVRGVRGVSVN